MSEEDLDYALALSLQDLFDRDSKNSHPESTNSIVQESALTVYDPKSIVDNKWELSDPNPDIHHLFVQYDQLFFDSTLVKNGVAVSWSNRMTLCAGVCSYQGRCGLCSIRLSQPLLKLRPRRDLVQTLLHEMIHAYLFVTANNTDHDGHGPNFQSHMHRINRLTGAKITIYHTFHDEVNVYRQHWWKCGGPCQTRPPFFGVVMRAMNRAPSPRDPWWAEHQRSCGGTYTKIKEPESYKKKVKGEKAGVSRTTDKDKGHILGSGVIKIDDIFSPIGAKNNIPGASVAPTLKDTDHKRPDHKSKAVTSVSVHENQDSTRSKMLAAAEKRQKENEGKDIVSYSKKRSLSHSSLGQSSSQESSVCKRTKFEPSSGQPSGQTDSSKSIDLNAVAYPTEQNTSTPSTSHIIDLSGGISQTPSPPDYPLKDTNKEGREVIIIDDHSQEFEEVFRTCPVCGVSNIPAAIINSHVSFCLDEEEVSQYID